MTWFAPVRRHPAPAAATGFACILLAATLVDLGFTVARSIAPPGPTDPHALPDGGFLSLTSRPVGDSAPWVRASYATVAIEPEQLDAMKRQLTVLVDLAFGCGLKHELVTTKGRSVGTIDSSCTQPRLYRRYRGLPVTVTLQGISPVFVSEFHVALHNLYESLPGQATLLGDPRAPNLPSLWSPALPVLWNPEAYPFDRFLLDATVFVTLPSGIVTSSQVSAKVKAAEIIPVDVVSRRMDGGSMDDKVLNAQVTDQIPAEGSYDPTSATMAVGRNWMTQAYTLAIAAVPLPLLAVLWHSRFRTRRRRQERSQGVDGPSPQELLLGLGAISLTILPLRIVLVPMEIPDLTLVDLILGMELIGLVIVGIAAYWWQLTQESRNPNAGSALFE